MLEQQPPKLQGEGSSPSVPAKQKLIFSKFFIIILIESERKEEYRMFKENKDYIFLRDSNSSCIENFRYDKRVKNLIIKFFKGGEYEYPNVDENIIRRWMKAESLGKFYNKEIRPLG